MVGILKGRRPLTASIDVPKPEPTNVSSRRKRRKNKGGRQHQESAFLNSYLLKRLIVLATTVLALTSSGSSLFKRSPRRFLQAEDDFSTIKIYRREQDQQQKIDVADAEYTQLIQREVNLQAVSGDESQSMPTRTTFTAQPTTKNAPAQLPSQIDSTGATKPRRGIRGEGRIDKIDRILKGGGGSGNGMSMGGMVSSKRPTSIVTFDCHRSEKPMTAHNALH